MYRCDHCAAPLRTADALAAGPVRPVACPRCGLRQFRPPVHPGVLVAAVVAAAFVAGALDVVAGVEAFPVWLGLMAVAIVAHHIRAYRRGRMRRWAYSPWRAWTQVTYFGLLAAGATVFAVAMVDLYRASAVPPKLARVEGVVEQVRRFGCDGGTCLTLADVPGGFAIDAASRRSLEANGMPEALQPGARVTLDVIAGADGARRPRPQRIVGLRLADIVVIDPDRTLADDREDVFLGMVVGLALAPILLVAAWFQWRTRRADARWRWTGTPAT
jgi:hypothetical protein